MTDREERLLAMKERRNLREQAQKTRDAAILRHAANGHTPTEIARITGYAQKVVWDVMRRHGANTERREGHGALLANGSP